jgi:curved DNA-binding protein CbpA
MLDVQVTSHYSLLGLSPHASAAEIRQARDRIIKRLREQELAEPERREELQARQKAVNAVGDELARPALREAYDAAHADLGFLTIRTAAPAMFVDQASRLTALERAMTAHLATKGVPVALSDLEREDFTADMSPDELLDELLDGPTDVRDDRAG